MKQLIGEDAEEAFAAWRRFEHLADRVTDVPVPILCTARRELLERRPSGGRDGYLREGEARLAASA